MLEEELGRLMLERARAEGHRPGLPKRLEEWTGICQPNRGRVFQLTALDKEVVTLLRERGALSVLDVVNELQWYTESKVWNAMKRMERNGVVIKGPVIRRQGRTVRLWVAGDVSDEG